MYEWRTGRSCLFKNNAHLVFVTKYRRDVFTKEMLDRTEEIMRDTCKQMDCELLEFGGEHDHIHMMISIHPKVAVSNLVSKLKGKSSYMLRREYWDRIKTMLWGNHFWSPSYCIVSCGGASLEVVKQYIENQKTPPTDKAVKISRSLKSS
jgi:putative transposase